MRIRRVPILVLIYWMIFLTPSISLAESTTTDIQRWEDEANHGSVLAPYQLGYSYQHGQGVKKNVVEAAQWYSLGADRGDLQSALILAGMYLKGEGVQKNEEKAIDWYVTIGKSSTWNAPYARANLLILARNYSLGAQGVKPDKTKARALFQRLFEIEMALIEQAEAQMNESEQKFNEALDKLKQYKKK